MPDDDREPTPVRVTLATAALQLARLTHRVRLRLRHGRDWRRYDTWS